MAVLHRLVGASARPALSSAHRATLAVLTINEADGAVTLERLLERTNDVPTALVVEQVAALQRAGWIVPAHPDGGCVA